MIFVTVGNASQGFDRLMEAIDAMAAANVFQEPVVVQFGNSRVIPRNCHCVRSVSRAEFRNLIAGTSLVITHGGAGSIGCCLQTGKKPVVVPRQQSFGELVDDHQVDLVRELESYGRIYAVHDIARLADVVRTAQEQGTTQPHSSGGSGVAKIVKDFLDILAESNVTGN